MSSLHNLDGLTCDSLRFIWIFFRWGGKSLSNSFWRVLQLSYDDRSNNSLILRR